MYMIARHHLVVSKASICRELAETRHRDRNPLLPRLSCAAQTWALGVTESLTVSARSAQSTNGRLPHHHVMSVGDINGLTHAAQPRRRAQKLRCEVRSRESDVTLRSAVTVTVPAEAVGLRTKRLSHHRMMSGSVCDGLELVRRAYNGRVIMAYALSSPSGGVAVGVNKVVHSSCTSFLSVC